jgi:nucleotide-binding universal stress UspA family protein
MMFKTILVHLDDSPRSAQRLGVVIRLATDFRSRLVGMYVVPTPELSPSLAALLPAEVVERRFQETGEAQQQAETLFRQAASAAGLTAIEWRAPAGSPIDTAVAHARCADLTVIGQGDPGSADSVFTAQLAGTVVLAAGRPTLIVPYVGARATLGQNVLVAWDGGREASRAIADAMPILASARQVTVMSIHAGAEERAADAPSRSRLAAYLDSHGIDAQIHDDDIADISVGDFILSRAADLGIDLIVMGAYAHTRLRDLVLGGVTRTMLQSMTVPVLMSH